MPIRSSWRWSRRRAPIRHASSDGIESIALIPEQGSKPVHRDEMALVRL
jgi:hypothetical protein